MLITMVMLGFACFSISMWVKICSVGGEPRKNALTELSKVDTEPHDLGMTLPSAKITMKHYSSPQLLPLLFFWTALTF